MLVYDMKDFVMGALNVSSYLAQNNQDLQSNTHEKNLEKLREKEK